MTWDDWFETYKDRYHGIHEGIEKPSEEIDKERAGMVIHMMRRCSEYVESCKGHCDTCMYGDYTKRERKQALRIAEVMF